MEFHDPAGPAPAYSFEEHTSQEQHDEIDQQHEVNDTIEQQIQQPTTHQLLNQVARSPCPNIDTRNALDKARNAKGQREWSHGLCGCLDGASWFSKSARAYGLTRRAQSVLSRSMVRSAPMRCSD